MRNPRRTKPEEPLTAFLARTHEAMHETPEHVYAFMHKTRIRRLRQQAERAIKRGFGKTLVDPRLILEVFPE